MPVHSKPMYFERLVCLHVDGVAQVLRQLLTCYSDPTTVDVFLRRYKSDFEKLYKRKVILKEQLDKLLPQGGATCDVNQLDITLLCLALKTACGLSSQEVESIDKLKDIRNRRCAHAPNTSLTEADFEAVWQESKDSLMELAKWVGIKTGNRRYEAEVQVMIDEFKQSPLEHFYDRLLDAINDWHRIQLQENRHDIALENILSHSEDFLLSADCSDEMARIVKSTSIYRRLRREMDEGPVVLPGMPEEEEDEKTVLANELVKDVGEEGKILVIRRSDDWSHVHFHGIDALLLFVDNDTMKYWPTIRRYSVTEKTLKVVMICEQKYVNDIKEKFPSCCIETVQSSKFTVAEKHSILKQTLKEISPQSVAPDVVINQCVEAFKSPIGFLQACKDLKAEPECAGVLRVREWFAYPFPILATLVEKIGKLTQSTTFDMSLVFLFHKRKIESSCLIGKKMSVDDQELLAHVCKVVCDNDTPKNITNLQKDFENVSATIVQKDENSFRFHNMMYEAVAKFHAKYNPIDVIKHCTPMFLLKHTGLMGGQRQMRSIAVSFDGDIPNIKKAIACKLAKEVFNINTGDEMDTFVRHQYLQHTDVIDLFFNNLQRTGRARAFVKQIVWTSAIGQPLSTEGVTVGLWYCMTTNEVNPLFVERVIENLQCLHTSQDNCEAKCTLCKICEDILLASILYGHYDIFKTAAQCAQLCFLPDLSAVVRTNSNAFMSNVITKLNEDRVWRVDSETVLAAECLAIDIGHMQIIDALRHHEVPPRSSLLVQAARKKNLALIREILTFMESHPSTGDNEILSSALESSLLAKSEPVFKFLLDKGAQLTPACLALSVECLDDVMYFKTVLQEADRMCDLTTDDKTNALAVALKLSKDTFSDEILDAFGHSVIGRSVYMACIARDITVEDITRILDMNSLRIADFSEDMSDILAHTVRTNNLELFTKLRERGAKINSECLYQFVFLHYKLLNGKSSLKELDRDMTELQLIEEYIQSTVEELKDMDQWNIHDPAIAQSIEMAFRSSDKDNSMYSYLVNAGGSLTMDCLKHAVKTGNPHLIAKLTKELIDLGTFNTNCIQAGVAMVTALRLDLGYGINYRNVTETMQANGLEINLHCMEPAMKTGDRKLAETLVSQLQRDGLWDCKSNILAKCFVLSLTFADQDMYLFLKREGITVSVKCLKIAMELELFNIIERIIEELKDADKWDTDSKDVALIVLEAYGLPGKRTYQTLINGKAYTLQQYLDVFAKTKDADFVQTIVEKLKKSNDWDPTSPDILKALESAISTKDKRTCKLILGCGVVFDTKFVINAVCSEDLGIVKEIVWHMKHVLLQKINPNCAELTESIVKTICKENTGIYHYLIKNGAMSPFELIHATIVQLKSYTRAEAMIKKLFEAQVWEHKNPTVLETMHWLLDSKEDWRLSVLKTILDCGVKIVPELLQKVADTGNIYLMGRVLKLTIEQGTFDGFATASHQYLSLAIKKNDPFIFELLLEQTMHVPNKILCLGLETAATADASNILWEQENVKRFVEMSKMYSENIWHPEEKCIIRKALATISSRAELYTVFQDQGMRMLPEYLEEYVKMADKDMVKTVISMMQKFDQWDPQNSDTIRQLFVNTIQSPDAVSQDPIWKTFVDKGFLCSSEYLAYTVVPDNSALAEECLKNVFQRSGKLSLAIHPRHVGTLYNLSSAMTAASGENVRRCLVENNVPRILLGQKLMMFAYVLVLMWFSMMYAKWFF